MILPFLVDLLWWGSSETRGMDIRWIAMGGWMTEPEWFRRLVGREVATSSAEGLGIWRNPSRFDVSSVV
jgi:hypothetical protein